MDKPNEKICKNNLMKKTGKLSKIKRLFCCSRNHEFFRKYYSYFFNQKVAGYIGYLDDDNFGDQALRVIFPKLFQPYQFLPYDPSVHAADFLAELLFYRCFIRRGNWYDVVMLGGGTLIDDWRWHSFQEAITQKIPCIVFGTGVRDPDFWTQFISTDTDVNYLSEWSRLLREAVYIGVRGPRSADLLEKYGLTRPKVIGDPIFSLGEPDAVKTERSRVVGINIGTHGRLWGDQNHINEVIGRVIRYLQSSGWKVELLPLQANDVRLSVDLIRNFALHDVSVWTHHCDIQRTMDRIKTYNVMIGQRLHSYGASAACGIPFIALEYEPKSADFLASVEMEDFGVRTDDLNPEKIIALFEMIHKKYAELSAKLRDKARYYRQLQHDDALSITALLSKRI